LGVSLSTSKRRTERQLAKARQEAREERARADELAVIAKLNEQTAYKLACQLHGKDAVDHAVDQAQRRGKN